MRYKIRLAYDGTAYAGWQVQPNAPTIQQLVNENLSKFLRKEIWVTGAGRTDAGVHAREQTAHFDFPDTIDPRTFLKAANGLLPSDIRVLSVEPTADDFHARYHAQGKIYHYHLFLDPVLDPFRRLYTLHFSYPISKEALITATKHFVGTHDFTSFANEPTAGAVAKNPVRTLHRLDVVPEQGGLRLEFEGNGFLYKMVRNITGALLDVARGKLSADTIPSILEAKDRRQAAKAAPAKGLFLVKTLYN